MPQDEQHQGDALTVDRHWLAMALGFLAQVEDDYALAADLLRDAPDAIRDGQVAFRSPTLRDDQS